MFPACVGMAGPRLAPIRSDHETEDDRVASLHVR
jgi:hypothetical protein